MSETFGSFVTQERVNPPESAACSERTKPAFSRFGGAAEDGRTPATGNECPAGGDRFIWSLYSGSEKAKWQIRKHEVGRNEPC